MTIQYNGINEMTIQYYGTILWCEMNIGIWNSSEFASKPFEFRLMQYIAQCTFCKVIFLTI